MISFLREVSQFTPDSFPLDGNRRLIAPFWADVDTRKGGVVYYRETQDPAIRKRASEEIRKYFVRQRRFSAKWVMIVTWLEVASYGGSFSPNVRMMHVYHYMQIYWREQRKKQLDWLTTNTDDITPNHILFLLVRAKEFVQLSKLLRQYPKRSRLREVSVEMR